ncbi:MAG TPA: hypothetical protein VN181_15395 [Thermoanaerobaculia bacterium]|nr:hypothetical protein [Thermoanaerobaculia bacterium]
MADVKISISNGKISVDKNKVTIAAGSERVTFKADGQFGIVMPSGHPNPVISPKGGGGKWEGQVGPFPEGSGTLKYDVTAPGAETLDPDIEILP